MAASVGPVVVGTDFSDTAALALEEARRLGALIGAVVDVVHVAEVPGPERSPAAEEWLARNGVAVDELVVRRGSPWVELVRYASEVSSLLVVLGSHGASGYQPLVIGNTASRVTVNARCPVVLVSPRAGGADAPRVQERRMAVRAEAGARSRPRPG